MASAATSSVKPNATAACGGNCFNLYSKTLGKGTILNAYIAGDTGTGGKIGQKVNLNFGSNTHPNEDFTGAVIGTLVNFCGSVLSNQSYVCINYPSNYPVLEADWSPYGNESGLCVGAYVPAYNGENTTLQNCGTSASTYWIADLANSSGKYTPLVNGASTASSHPLVATVDPGTTKPINQVKLQPLNFLTGGKVPDTQLWDYYTGQA
jgi:hypothetical protein